MRIGVMVMTDGRSECLTRTMKAMYEHLHGPVSDVMIVNDSPDDAYADWLDTMYPHCQRVHHHERKGFAGAIQSGWEHVGPVDWVFHLEDDFVIQRPVPLLDLVATMAGQPQLVQMALRRQPVNAEEYAAGGVIERWPTEYIERTNTRGSWLEHRLFFTTNPSLYRPSLTRLGWPQVEGSEAAFTQRLLREGVRGVPAEKLRFAFWGRRVDPPWVEHIGIERVGTGY